MAASSLMPPAFWGIDGLLDSFPRLCIQDVNEMPEVESHPGIFHYRDHPIHTVDILGIIVKVDNRDKVIIYTVDDGTGVISCCCFKNYGQEEIQPINQLINSDLMSGPLHKKLEFLLKDKEQLSSGFGVGELLHVRGTVKTYNSVREIKAFFCAVVSCPDAEVERMLRLPQLYRMVYDKPFTLPFVLASEVGSLGGTEPDQRRSTRELEAHEKLMKLIMVFVDGKELEVVTEQDLKDSLEVTADPDVDWSLIWKKAMVSLEATGHLCKQPACAGGFMVVKYNKALHRSVIEIVTRHMELHKGRDIGCHFLHIYEELRKQLLFSELNKSSLWKCLSVLEEQSEIISTSDKHFIVFV